MNKKQLQTILKINGCSEQAADEEVRAILLSAKYSPDEVENALVILRSNDVAAPIRSDGLHTVFYTDNRLQPREIAGLLGVEVDLDFGARARTRALSKELTGVEIALVVGLAVLFAVIGTGLYMYIHDIGFFHSLAIAA
jgi:hypothetical protein